MKLSMKSVCEFAGMAGAALIGAAAAVLILKICQSKSCRSLSSGEAAEEKDIILPTEPCCGGEAK